MNETPEEKIFEEVETPEKEKEWTEDITIPVPLSEFLKMKKKISKLENKCEKLKEEATEQRHLKWAKESELTDKCKAYDELKSDYEKLLGIGSEEKPE